MLGLKSDVPARFDARVGISSYRMDRAQFFGHGPAYVAERELRRRGKRRRVDVFSRASRLPLVTSDTLVAFARSALAA
jgi:hypothetical protein